MRSALPLGSLCMHACSMLLNRRVCVHRPGLFCVCFAALSSSSCCQPLPHHSLLGTAAREWLPLHPHHITIPSRPSEAPGPVRQSSADPQHLFTTTTTTKLCTLRLLCGVLLMQASGCGRVFIARARARASSNPPDVNRRRRPQARTVTSCSCLGFSLPWRLPTLS